MILNQSRFKSRAFTLYQLKKFAASNPPTDLRDRANFIIASLEMKQRHYKQAAEYASRVGVPDFEGNHGDQALLMTAQAFFALGQYNEALNAINGNLRSGERSSDVELQLREIRFNIDQQLGNRLAALADVAYLAKNAPDATTRQLYKTAGVSLVDSRLTQAELQQVANDSQYSFLQARALYRLGSLALIQDNLDKAHDLLSQASSDAASNSSIAKKAQSLLNKIQARQQVDPHTIGTILPLSGPFAQIGYTSLRGIQLALGIFGPHPSNFKLAVIDSDGNKEVAREGVRTLVYKDNAIGLIGGLMSHTAFAEATKAQELQIPTIALTQAQGITSIGNDIFRDSLTSQLQVHALVWVAMNDLHYKRFAILAPSDAYGRQFAKLFWSDVVANGGIIAAAELYDPRETDFHTQVEKLVGTYFSEDRQNEYYRRLRKWRLQQIQNHEPTNKVPSDLLPPVVDFDAVFVPDDTKAAGQIAPMLAYQDVNNVRLLGTNLWDNTDLVDRGQKFVENALFVDSFLSTDPSFTHSKFYLEYVKTFGSDPDLFALQAYDSAMVLRHILESGTSTRDGVRDALSSLDGVPGALGPLKTMPNREISRPVVALTVKDGQIIKANLPIHM